MVAFGERIYSSTKHFATLSELPRPKPPAKKVSVQGEDIGPRMMGLEPQTSTI